MQHMEGNLVRASKHYEKFLDNAAQFGRSIFTQFNIPLMLLGVALQIAALWLGCVSATWDREFLQELLLATRDWGSAAAHYCTGAVILALLHALAGISDNCIKQEHWLVLSALHVLFFLALRGSPRGSSPDKWGLIFWALVSIWGAWLCNLRHRTEVSALFGGSTMVTDIVYAAVRSPTGQAAGQAAFCLTSWAALIQINLSKKCSAWFISSLLIPFTSTTASICVFLHSSRVACESLTRILILLGVATDPTSSLLRLFAARTCIISSIVGVCASLLCKQNQSKYASLCYHTAMAVVLVTGPGAAIAIALVGVHMWCISRAICLESLLRPRTYENSRHQSSRKGVERTLILVGFALHGAALSRLLFLQLAA